MTIRESVYAIVSYVHERLRRLPNWLHDVRSDQPLQDSQGRSLVDDDSVFQPRESDMAAKNGGARSVDARSKNVDT